MPCSLSSGNTLSVFLFGRSRNSNATRYLSHTDASFESLEKLIVPVDVRKPGKGNFKGNKWKESGMRGKSTKGTGRVYG